MVLEIKFGQSQIDPMVAEGSHKSGESLGYMKKKSKTGHLHNPVFSLSRKVCHSRCSRVDNTYGLTMVFL